MVLTSNNKYNHQYKHLTATDRGVIKYLLLQEELYSSNIADCLKCHKSTIYCKVSVLRAVVYIHTTTVLPGVSMIISKSNIREEL